jgi:hypothetical protein
VVLDADDLQAVGERALLERDRRDRQRVRRACRAQATMPRHRPARMRRSMMFSSQGSAKE